MRCKVTAPDGSRFVLTADNPEALKLAIEQMFGGPPQAPTPAPDRQMGPPPGQPMGQAALADNLPPMVEVGEEAPAPSQPPEAPSIEPEAPSSPAIAPAPNPMEQLVPLIMDAVDRLASSIDNMGVELGAGLEAQGEKIEAAAAQQAQSIATLAEAMDSEQEVVRDDDGRVKGARRVRPAVN